ncbi:50S ribosomal protein L23 [Kamptonema cortianum]|nr:50S ribosomal protein L23 [Geitlerinema splendidum]MDK3160412.1 50S ribosomal protein L23 [Kamptonema cortianum]
MRDPHTIVVRPHITEKTVKLSYGDPRIQNDEDIVRKYTFVVAPNANKIEIKSAIEHIYNDGKKDKDHIQVTSVATVKVKGKTRRVGQRSSGSKPDWKKAVVTLAKGQILEDYGV